MDERFEMADKKLTYADFLLNNEGEQFNNAAIKHVCEAANIGISILTDFNDTQVKSPQLLKQAAAKFEEPEPKQFAKFYLNFLQAIAKNTAKRADTQQALYKVRDFLKWIKGRGI